MSFHFEQIAKAIVYLKDHTAQQPSLEEVAEVVRMSPYHFQRIFQEWASVTPKQFLKYLTITHARELLKHPTPLLQASHSLGLSSSGRLHDLFVSIEAMTPGEYRDGSKGLSIEYRYEDTLFGGAMIGNTSMGICHISFAESEEIGVEHLRERFSNALLLCKHTESQQAVIDLFHHKDPTQLKLHLKGTPFQIKVWEALLSIPEGQLTTYGAIAHHIGHHKAHRAVGTAVGDNPVAFIIPCHRVIRGDGSFGQYHWGPERKVAMIGWEIAHTSSIT